MTWFDLALLIFLAVIILWEVRQEAGRALLDAVATLGAGLLARAYAPALTSQLDVQPLPGGDVAPGVQLGLFAACWILGLGLSRLLHRQTRWSMDQFDPVFAVLFAVVTGVSAAHTLTDLAAGLAVQQAGHLPDYLRHSALAEEVRSFRTYHYVLDVMHSFQYEGGR